eukprot:5441722-Heterocapsa_arctica.AAC.1
MLRRTEEAEQYDRRAPWSMTEEQIAQVAEDSREAIELMEQRMSEIRACRARAPEEEPPSAGQGAATRAEPVDARPRAERGYWQR